MKCSCPVPGAHKGPRCHAERYGFHETADEWCNCRCHEAPRVRHELAPGNALCARCGHTFLKHQTPGTECCQVIGRDAQGFEAYCDCPSFREVAQPPLRASERLRSILAVDAALARVPANAHRQLREEIEFLCQQLERDGL